MSPFHLRVERLCAWLPSGELSLCFDARIFSEYAEVLRRPKFKFEEEKIAALLDHIKHRGRAAASSPLLQALPDPDDEPFLEVAMGGQAACLVTGNHAHFPPHLCQPVKVLSPSEFLSFFKQHITR